MNRASTNTFLIFASILATTVCACPARTPPAVQGETASGPNRQAGDDLAPRVLLDVPLTYDVTDRALHCPMVDVSVGGLATKLILDSGSTDHVLTIELANRVRLDSKPTDPGTDHAGALVPSWTLGEVPVRIGDVDLRLRNTIAIKGPAPFDAWGVGGFLSPQNLHPSAHVVLDLVGDRLVLVDGDTRAVSEWLAARYPALRLLTLRREPGSTVLVNASVAPFAQVVTMLNTGGRQTEFARSTVPGLRGTPPESVGHGVSSAEVLGEEVPRQTLRVGEASFAVPTLLVRDKMSAPHGLVGMDVLRGTVLVVSADADKPLHWLVRPAPATPALPR